MSDSSDYPGALDSFAMPTSTDNQDAPPHAELHRKINNAAAAIQAELGINPRGTYATVRARLDDLVTGQQMSDYVDQFARGLVAEDAVTGTFPLNDDSEDLIVMDDVPLLASRRYRATGQAQLSTDSTGTRVWGGLAVKVEGFAENVAWGRDHAYSSLGRRRVSVEALGETFTVPSDGTYDVTLEGTILDDPGSWVGADFNRIHVAVYDVGPA